VHNTLAEAIPTKEGSVTRRSNLAFVAITLSEVTKGSGAPDEILTYGYVKPRVQWFLNEEDPPTDPSKIAQGLRGYTHSVRSRAPSGEETLPSLTTSRPPLGARGLVRALRLSIYANTSGRPLAPARPMMLAKARAQEDTP
jgi:hypothetical protein